MCLSIVNGIAAVTLDTLDIMSHYKKSVVRGSRAYKILYEHHLLEIEPLVINCKINNSRDSYSVTVYLEDFEFPCCSSWATPMAFSLNAVS